MSKNSDNFLHKRASLLNRIQNQTNKMSKIEICILYAIEEENITNYERIRSLTNKICEELGLFENSKNPSHRFNTEFSKAKRSLIQTGRINEIHHLVSIIPPIATELERISSYLEQNETTNLVYSGLNSLWSLSREFNVSSEKKIISTLLNIIKNNKLLDDTKIFVETMKILAEIFNYIDTYQPKNSAETKKQLCKYHVKEICLHLSSKKNLDDLNNACNHLFAYTSCQIVVSTIFDFIQKLSDEEYRYVEEGINYALYNNDSKLFKELHLNINGEIQNLLKQPLIKTQKRAYKLNRAYTRRNVSINTS